MTNTPQTQSEQEELIEKLRDILFKASGGISDMANEEIAAIMQLFTQELERKVEEAFEDGRKYRSIEIALKRSATNGSLVGGMK